MAEDAYPGFAFSDLAAFVLPLPVSGDHGRVGALGEDQQDVVEAVLVEGAGKVEESLPLPALGELLYLLDDGRV